VTSEILPFSFAARTLASPRASKPRMDSAQACMHSYPSISASWRRHWVTLIAFFDYPDEIRKVIYTTNAIESVNSVTCKATERRKLFTADQSAIKVVYLAIEQSAKK
jgi:transposase-like protein